MKPFFLTNYPVQCTNWINSSFAISLEFLRLQIRKAWLLKLPILLAAMLLLTAQGSFAQTGYIYVHKSTLNEESATSNFGFTGSGSIGSFNLNDLPAYLGAIDLGAGSSSATGAAAATNGSMLYVIAASGNAPTIGTIYIRNPGSTAWQATGGGASRIDGGPLTKYVYTANSGNVYLYTGSGINDQLASNARDVAYDRLNDRLYYVNTSGAIFMKSATGGGWTTALTNSAGNTAISANWIDVAPDGKLIIGLNNNVFTWVYSGAGVSGAVGGLGSPNSTAILDVAAADDGSIYATSGVGAWNVFRWTGSAWVKEVRSIDVTQVTGGAGGQVWGIVNNATSPHTVWTRTSNAGWIDDERVRTTPANTNAAVFAVAPGSYTINESNIPSGWALQTITIDDPTSNSSGDISTNTATINVVAGEMVHVTFENGLTQSTAVSNTCGLAFTEDFGTGSLGVLGPVLTGVTNYHWQNNSGVAVGANALDGYYARITRSSDVGYGAPGFVTTFDHTNDAGGLIGHYAFFNANYQANTFYRRRFTGLIPGATYTLSYWIINQTAQNNTPGVTTTLIPPNVLAAVIDPATGDTLSSLSSGNITTAYTWQNKTFTFTASQSSIDLFLSNNNIGGAGNDLGIDDITFSFTPPTTPVTTIVHTGCGTTGSITVTSPVGGTYEYSKDNFATAPQSSPVFSNLAAGVHTISVRFVGSNGCVTSKTDTVRASICGNVFNDINGLTDNIVNGTGTNGGGVNIVLYDSTRMKVMQVIPVAADGSYSIVADSLAHKYTLFITTANPAIGSVATPAITLPGTYVTVGEGTVATGDGTPNGVLPLGIVNSPVTNANFGIEQPPTAVTFTSASQQNPLGNGKLVVPTLNGNDPEQGSFPGTGNQDTIIIRTLPSNATLYYNGVAVVAGDTIKNYNPALLTVDPTPTSGSFNISFQYSEVDAALKSSANATVTIPVIDPTPFNCANNIAYQVAAAASTGPSTLYSYNINNGVRTTVAPLTTLVNGIGYNITDNMLWGGDLINDKIVRIDAGGNMTSFTIPNLPFVDKFNSVGGSIGNAFNVGTISTNGYMYLYTTSDSVYYVLDVNPARPTYLQLVNPLAGYVLKTGPDYGTPITGYGNLYIEDWVLAPSGNLQSIIRQGQPNAFNIVTMNPTTGVTVISGTPITGDIQVGTSGGFGGHFMDVLGNYYVYISGSGKFIKVNTADNTSTYLSTALTSGFNDGANCPLAILSAEISGTVFHDANGLYGTPANTVDGTGFNPGSLNAILYDSTTMSVVAVVPVGSDGTFNFTATPGNQYTVFISTASPAIGPGPVPAVVLPGTYVPVGENNGSGAGSDGVPNGILPLGVVSGVVDAANFGIEQPPTAVTFTGPSQQNPAGTGQSQVPTLNGSDPEQGTFPGTGNLDTVIIRTLPTNGTLYYNGVAVVAGDTIKNYNPALLTVDPNDGITSLSFTYSEVDAALQSSAPATVTMPFTTAIDWVCENIMYEVSGSGSASDIHRINVNTGVTTVLATYGVSTNSIGYNPFDNKIWGIQNGNTLVRIDAAGVVQNMLVPNLTFASAPAIGAISSTGYYYVTAATGVTSSGYYVIDVNPARATYLKLVDRVTFAALTSAPYTFGFTYPSPITAIGIGDWAFGADGNLWGVAHQAVGATDGNGTNWERLFKMNPATGVITIDAPVLNPVLGNLGTFGSVVVDATGTMYAKRNNTGGIYKINLTTGENSLISTSAVVGFNDGAVCPTAVLSYSIKGNVYNDVNGITDGTINGQGTNAGTTLYAVLYDNTTGQVIDSAVVRADGSYHLDNGVAGNLATVYLTTTPVTLFQTAVPVLTPPVGYAYVGEVLNATTGAGTDGSPNGILAIGLLNSNFTQANFGIEQPPTANPVSGTFINPGGTATITVPTLNGNDPEQGSLPGIGNLDTVVIKTLPAGGTLYYDADGPGGLAPVAVVAGDTIRNYNPANLTFDPPTGNGIYTFDYVEVDAALKASAPATVTMNFSALTLSGTVLNDVNGMNNSLVDGPGTNVGGTVYANLVNPGTNQVIASVAVDASGQYSFGVAPNTSYNVILTNGPASGTLLSSPYAAGAGGWISTGEGTVPTGDGNPNGIVSVAIDALSIADVNFGIEQPPTANNVSGNYTNPGGTATVQVPTLNGSDPEQGILPGINNLDTVIIDTRPVLGTLYYNGVAIPTNGFRINNYNPALLTYDPPAGGGTYTFTYREMDAAGKTSSPATVTMNFTDITISGTVHRDADGGIIDGPGIGSPASTQPIQQLYVNLVSNGNIVGVVPVNANGSYSLTTENGVKPDATFTTVLSPTQGNIGQPATTLAPVSSISTSPGWVVTAEGDGGTNGDGSPDGQQEIIITGNSSAANKDFAIEQPPTAKPGMASFLELTENVPYPLGPSSGEPVTPNPLSGTDPEDVNIGNGGSFIITSLPANAKLYYDGDEITDPGMVINGYDPDKLEFSVNNTSVISTSFTYQVVDAAGVASPPVIYNIGIITILPVTGLELKAIVQAGKPQLQWTTLTEQNTSHFELARSVNGTNFTVITTVTAAGSSNTLKTYSFTDNNAGNSSAVYYKVRLLDKDGRAKESNIINVSLSGNTTLKVFPNPASEFVMVTGLPEGARILLYDGGGRLLREARASTNSQRISLQGIASGTVWIKVVQKDKVVAVKNIMRQ